MSSLGPDDELLERDAIASEIATARDVSPPIATNVAAAPLWMAFRDYYTRAKARTRLTAEGEFNCDGFSHD